MRHVPLGGLKFEHLQVIRGDAEGLEDSKAAAEIAHSARFGTPGAIRR